MADTLSREAATMPSPIPPKERRQYHRVPVNFVMRFKRWERGGRLETMGAPVELVGTDISEAGAGGAMDAAGMGGRTLAPGDRMLLEIELEGGAESFMVAAKLKWNRLDGERLALQFAGFQFDHLPEEAKKGLRRMVFRDLESRGEFDTRS
jgi:c-di-GMP-binding flagellar brake protein YcgR